jgi:hypothetical protein
MIYSFLGEERRRLLAGRPVDDKQDKSRTKGEKKDNSRGIERCLPLKMNGNGGIVLLVVRHNSGSCSCSTLTTGLAGLVHAWSLHHPGREQERPAGLVVE